MEAEYQKGGVRLLDAASCLKKKKCEKKPRCVYVQY